MDVSPEVIVVDIGNSAIKLAIARCGLNGEIALSGKLQWLHGEFEEAELARFARREPAHWWIASVHRSKAEMIKEWIAEHRPGHLVTELSHVDLPLKIVVEAPQRVGIDRLLTAVAANRHRTASSAAITITAGTAVTVNAIDSQGSFLGGAILPGWPLLAKSLHQYTDALPLVTDLSTEQQPIGKNTQDAIRSGIHFGLLGAVEKLIAEFEKEVGGKAELFFAGGDAAFIHDSLGRGQLAPDLVLEGAALVAFSRADAT